MVTITYITSDGREFTVNAEIGDTVMRAAQAHGVPGIEAECGGGLTCATCRVGIPPEWQGRLSPASADEQTMLEYCEDPAPATRLSCQIEIDQSLDGLRVTIPETQH
ncbi:2Fe-2S ferredoxin [Sphingobium jiangsuense]|uniref:2Fe-2S ferredoxin n=2 Tax=Sphingobium TaxID=165695 RepID=A0A7W6BJV8_9SPHN|nr:MULTISPECIES: 2Fe-2S iron-sulfur cluster-binding protein [Sphingobium]QEH81009.1 2Fe-2S iron-sulfur cluster binding domain-containing protein [Sphingomonas sp. C8-2]SCW96268.1 ferredoxin, 2Fe-2S [Sphingobium faniae]AHZ46795.1 PbaB [Sphingobium wenxiniae]MBB3926376.1 2Fe-2S ferredoxin [Sphingobium jiangsuense]GLS99082.1 2Fe-2S ferredoxin [Sphingobium jiangsuense]